MSSCLSSGCSVQVVGQIQLSAFVFSLFSIEKMQFFCREKALLTQITCCGLNKDWLSGFSLFCNTVRHVLGSIGCTLFTVRTAIPVNEKIPTSWELYVDG